MVFVNSIRRSWNWSSTRRDWLGRDGSGREKVGMRLPWDTYVWVCGPGSMMILEMTVGVDLISMIPQNSRVFT